MCQFACIRYTESSLVTVHKQRAEYIQSPYIP